MDEFDAREEIGKLREFVLQLAERIAICSEILGRLAERKRRKPMRLIENSCTDEWVEVFDKAIANNEDFKTSFWWRMSLTCLPLGVNENDSRVVAAMEVIRQKLSGKQS